MRPAGGGERRSPFPRLFFPKPCISLEGEEAPRPPVSYGGSPEHPAVQLRWRCFSAWDASAGPSQRIGDPVRGHPRRPWLGREGVSSCCGVPPLGRLEAEGAFRMSAPRDVGLTQQPKGDPGGKRSRHRRTRTEGLGEGRAGPGIPPGKSGFRPT